MLPFLDSLFFSVLTEANKSSSSSSSSNNPPEDFGGASLLSWDTSFFVLSINESETN